MDKRVCDWFSEILRMPARVPIVHGTQCPRWHKVWACCGSWMQRWWLMTAPKNRYSWLLGRGGIEKTRWKVWLAEHGTITAWISKPWERERLFYKGSDGTTFQIKMPQKSSTVKRTCRTWHSVLLRDDCEGQGGTMERRRVGGVKIRGVYVDLHQSRTVRWTPSSGSEANAPDHHGMHELGMWGLLVGNMSGWRSPTFSRRRTTFLEALNYDLDVPWQLQWDFCGSPHRQAQSKICKWWDESSKVSRHCEHSDWDHIWRALWRSAHATNGLTTNSVAFHLYCANHQTRIGIMERSWKSGDWEKCPLLPPYCVGSDESSAAWKRQQKDSGTNVSTVCSGSIPDCVVSACRSHLSKTSPDPHPYRWKANFLFGVKNACTTRLVKSDETRQHVGMSSWQTWLVFWNQLPRVCAPVVSLNFHKDVTARPWLQSATKTAKTALVRSAAIALHVERRSGSDVMLSSHLHHQPESSCSTSRHTHRSHTCFRNRTGLRQDKSLEARKNVHDALCFVSVSTRWHHKKAFVPKKTFVSQKSTSLTTRLTL